MSRLTAKVAEMGIYARFASSDERDIIQKLGEYEDLEEAGRLVKLPCKVGDTVYQLGALRRTIAEHPVSSFSISSGIYMLLDDGLSKIVADTRDFGKTIFLTREAAEAALNVPDTNVGNIEEGAGQ